MPVNQSMMQSMRKQYGSKKGEKVYYATERKHKLAEALSKRKK